LIDLENLLQILFDKGIKKLMVEGGSTVISHFLKSGFVDDIYIYIAPFIIGGVNTPTLAKFEIDLELVEAKNIGSGVLLHYRLRK